MIVIFLLEQVVPVGVQYIKQLLAIPREFEYINAIECRYVKQTGTESVFPHMKILIVFCPSSLDSVTLNQRGRTVAPL